MNVSRLKQEAESIDSVARASIERQHGETVVQVQAECEIIDALDDLAERLNATFKPNGRFMEYHEYVLR